VNPTIAHSEFFLFSLYAFLFGLTFGSFLNVCIYRLPRGLSVVSPRSACPACHSPVRAKDNIPVLSWFILHGHCRDCAAPISMRYIAVELLTALLFLACVLRFGVTIETLKFAIFSFLLTGLAFTDAELRLLPDTLTLTGAAMGLAFAPFTAVGGPAILFWPHGTVPLWTPQLQSLSNSLFAGLLGAGLVWAAAAGYKLLRRVEGMGFGDVKLMLMIGLFLGVKLMFFTLLVGSFAGSVVGGMMLVSVFLARFRRQLRRHDPNARRHALRAAQLVYSTYELPFGVFLCSAALVAAFFGDFVLRWYLHLYL